MKLVVAIIRPQTYVAVQAALDELGIKQLTITEVLGRGHEQGHRFIYRGTTFQDARLKRLKLEVVVEDDAVDAVVEAIQDWAKSGEVGDGVIFVTPLEGFVRIRTGHYLNDRDVPAATAGPVRPPFHRLNQTVGLTSHG